MFFNRNVFALACYVILHSTANTETPNEKSKEDFEPDEDSTRHDDHTFVALIDIVFTDGSKRTCTGTIIHDNVVVTAAHCFSHEYTESIKPELTASFVVIGTKKMFDSGYEQYLPIERILIHPKFKGWTADLSLIYTFAAMTSDKPGKIIPLAGEKISNPVDSNVTVFSWGRCKEHGIKHKWHSSKTATTKPPCPDDSSAEEPSVHLNSNGVTESSPEEPSVNLNSNVEHHRVTQGINSKRSRDGELKLEQEYILEQARESKKQFNQQSRFRKESRQEDLFHRFPSLQQKLLNKVDVYNTPNSKQLSRYLTSSEDNKESEPRTHEFKNLTDIPEDTVKEELKFLRGRIVARPASETIDKMKMYRNWRRNMGKTQNKLTVEVFGFVNLAACKKIVEGSNTAPHYDFKNGEVACYTSDEHFITAEDSGAPAIRHGHLVAVTVGGAQCDGDHVGVGMKMSCYCTWIADNLPGGGANINCCKNCCEAINEEATKNAHRNRNKYLI